MSGLAWSLCKCAVCGGLSMVLLQLKDPLELFVKRREFLPGSGFLSAVESDVKPHSFLPSFMMSVVHAAYTYIHM